MWSGGTFGLAGGLVTGSSGANNPQFRVTIDRAAPFVLTLTQPYACGNMLRRGRGASLPLAPAPYLHAVHVLSVVGSPSRVCGVSLPVCVHYSMRSGFTEDELEAIMVVLFRGTSPVSTVPMEIISHPSFAFSGPPRPNRQVCRVLLYGWLCLRPPFAQTCARVSQLDTAVWVR